MCPIQAGSGGHHPRGDGAVLADGNEGAGTRTIEAPGDASTGYILVVDDAGQTWLVQAGDRAMAGGEHEGGSESGGEHGDRSGESGGEHGSADGPGEGSEGGAEAGEESGTQYATTEVYDETRAGARLLLAYDPQSNAFYGIVANTTDTVLPQVRVEVHLSNGTELGPTTPTDLAPGQVMTVMLPATDAPFDSYGAHPEVGSEVGGEHGSEGGTGEAGEAGHDESGEG